MSYSDKAAYEWAMKEIERLEAKIKDFEAAAKAVMHHADVIGHAGHPTFQTLNNLIEQ